LLWVANASMENVMDDYSLTLEILRSRATYNESTIYIMIKTKK
jgi:hypothetical protein